MNDNDKIDTVNIRSGFLKMVLSKIVRKAIVKHFKNEGVDILLGNIDAVYSGGKLHINIEKAEIEIDGTNIVDLLEL